MRKAEIVATADSVKAPVSYTEALVDKAVADSWFEGLWSGLDWVEVAGPRREYYCHDWGSPYTYGRGVGIRTYHPQPYHPILKEIRAAVEAVTKCKLEVLFLNGYRDGLDHLGWHSDNSDTIDSKRPIAIVSLGARRQIMFKPIGTADQERFWLDHGSLCLMQPGMQETHQHRIPKAGFICGPRISLTFRGAMPPS